MAPPQTAREVAEFLKASAEKVGKMTFTNPDDDWMHMGFIVSMDGQGAFFVLDGSVLVPERKEQALRELSVIILKRKPKVIAFVLNTRQVRVSATTGLSRAAAIQEASRIRQTLPENLKDEPTATEALVVSVNTRSDSVMWQAEIKRDDKNIRTLGKWTEWADRESRFDDMTKIVFGVMDALRDVPPQELDRAIDAIIADGRLATYEIERPSGKN